jgi:hypothetical protein
MTDNGKESEVLMCEPTALSPVHDHLDTITPRALGSTIFHGSRRDVVYSRASGWAARSKNAKAKLVPGAKALIVNTCAEHIEVDLDVAVSADARAFFEWVAQIVKSRHCLFGSHLVIVHGVDKAPPGALSTLMRSPHAVLVASTTKPCSGQVRCISGATHVRVPCADALRVPLRAKKMLTELVADVESARESTHTCVHRVRMVVHALRCAGFTLDEISLFANSVIASGRLADEIVAKLAHIACCPTSDSRATETLVTHLLHASKVRVTN